MPTTKKQVITIIVVIAFAAMAAVAVIACIFISKNSRGGAKNKTDFEKEYFRAYRAQDYEALYELMYKPYVDAIAKKEGVSSMKGNVTDYYKQMNEKVTYEHGSIKSIEQKLSNATDLKQEELNAINQELESLGLKKKAQAGVSIELVITYTCEKDTVDVDFDYYAIEVDGRWYFYNTELAPIYEQSAAAGEPETTEAQEGTTRQIHSIEFIVDYGMENEKVILTKDDIEEAEAMVSDSDFVKYYVVQIKFTEQGSKIFAEETAANVGKKITIVCDGKVILEPTVNAVVEDGVTWINNFESFEAARSFADSIR